MSKKLNGAILGYFQIGLKVIIALIFTPILVGALGQEGYGLFSIVGAMAAYLYLLDFGLNDGVLRYFVRHENNAADRDEFLGQMLGLYALLGCGVFVIGWVVRALAVPVFSSSLAPEEILLLQDMFTVLVVGAAILIAFNPVSALISASENFVFLRGLEITASILSTAIIIFLLDRGFGALMVVVVMTAGTASQVLMRVIYTITVLHARVVYAKPRKNEVQSVLKYSAPIFLGLIAGLIYWKLDHIIIGVFVGAAPVAIYAIGVMFNKYFMSFATAISRVMTPDVIRQLDEGADAEQLTKLMIRISRIQALLLLLVLSGLFVFGQRFIELWLGPEYSISYYVMLAVLVPYTLELIGNVRNVVLQVRGLYWYRTSVFLVIALVNIPATIILLKFYGVIGAAISTGIGISISYALIAVLLQVKLGLNMRHYFVELGRGLLPAALVSIGAGLLLDHFMPGSWIGFVACVVLFSAIYAGMMTMLGINAYERDLAMRILHKLPKISRLRV